MFHPLLIKYIGLNQKSIPSSTNSYDIGFSWRHPSAAGYQSVVFILRLPAPFGIGDCPQRDSTRTHKMPRLSDICLIKKANQYVKFTNYRQGPAYKEVLPAALRDKVSSKGEKSRGTVLPSTWYKNKIVLTEPEAEAGYSASQSLPRLRLGLLYSVQ